jgi:hypothetical protein
VAASSSFTELYFVTGNRRGDTYGYEIPKDHSASGQVLVRIDQDLRVTSFDSTVVPEEMLRDLHVTESGQVFGVTEKQILEFDPPTP